MIPTGKIWYFQLLSTYKSRVVSTCKVSPDQQNTSCGVPVEIEKNVPDGVQLVHVIAPH